MSLVGRVFSNRYEIQRELAQGGMAEVYLARDRLLDRPVALKALFPEYARDPSFVERFRREAQAAANLNHPNIVAIHDWGQETGTYFIVMEFVEGRSLRDVIRAEGPLNAHQAAEITAEIASALAFAHRTGVVHRDVKPGNVLITRSGSVKVTDFGILTRPGTSEGLTQTGSVMGTATYFSPEQAQGIGVDGRSDVYSLGVVLYEMVTGVAPFAGDSPVAIAYKHVREEPVPPSRRNPDVPHDLEQIILTAMAKDPDFRYQTADDLRADLLRFRRGRPLAAAPVTAIVAEVTGAVGPGAATMASPRVAPDATMMGAAVHTQPRRRRGLAAALAFLALIAIVAGIILVSQVAGKDADKLSVPNVVGDDVADAREELEGLGFAVETDEVVNDEIPPNEVISQSPKGGRDLEKGGTVTLTVSLGSGDVEIPSDILNRSAEEAKATLEALEFAVEIVVEQSDDVPFGELIRTEPPPGTRAGKGAAVRLVVSGGPEPIVVPNVLNQSDTDAAAALASQGFTVQIIPEPSDTVEENKVIRTEPGPNAQALEGALVKVYVSSGPEKVAIPDSRGKLEAAAIAQIEGVGLSASVIYAPSTSGNNGKVIAIDPTQGTEVALGSTVVLTVGVFEPPTTTTATTTPSTGP